MLINDVKIALRITNDSMDSEIYDLIQACKSDLGIAGVDTISETDPLIKRAIITYCKAHFGYDNPDADRFIESYNSLKNHLAISSLYHNYEVTT